MHFKTWQGAPKKGDMTMADPTGEFGASLSCRGSRSAPETVLQKCSLFVENISHTSFQGSETRRHGQSLCSDASHSSEILITGCWKVIRVVRELFSHSQNPATFVGSWFLKPSSLCGFVSLETFSFSDLVFTGCNKKKNANYFPA